MTCRRKRIVEKVSSFHSGQTLKPKATKEPSKQPKTLVETPPSSSKKGSQSVKNTSI